MKTKTKFSKGEAVTNGVNAGTVQEATQFPDHVEYLVEFPDKTATWIHENDLKPNS